MFCIGDECAHEERRGSGNHDWFPVKENTEQSEGSEPTVLKMRYLVCLHRGSSFQNGNENCLVAFGDQAVLLPYPFLNSSVTLSMLIIDSGVK